MNEKVNVEKLLNWLSIKGHKKGHEYWACCPFHGEREPSWQIRDEVNSEKHSLWRCFGCGAQGNSIMLVAELMGVGYKRAKDMMDDRGLFNHISSIPSKIEIALPYKILSFRLPLCVEFPVWSDWAEDPKQYVIARGITKEQIERWNIGYAVYGRLGSRIVFPIVDFQGKIVGYSARTYINSPKRYLEPHSGEGAKSGTIFGMKHWPDYDVRQFVCITEGVINALAVERALDACPTFDTVVPPIAAIRGSNLLESHILALSTFKHFFVLSDNDQAGDKLWGQIKNVFGKEAVRINIPKGLDCAEMDCKDLVKALEDGYEVFYNMRML
jgi:DNA primase